MKKEFKKKKYCVVKKIVDPKVCSFVYSYLIMQASVVKDLLQKKLTYPQNHFIGTFADSQVRGVYSKHGDWAMETLLAMTIKPIKKYTGLDLIPTYSYTRLYETGSKLARHKDRASCEISGTLNLGGDPWTIYIDPTGEDNVIDTHFDHVGEQTKIKNTAHKGIAVDLEPGDILLYSGCDLEHWREPFKGKLCGQVFLHYNNKKGPFGTKNIYDGRPMLGYPKL
jgi:hypothetical protein|tara:strand:- start:2245 stop:2916 length:672 start_codon:yes stop_codon:yes gene_type:complete